MKKSTLLRKRKDELADMLLREMEDVENLSKQPRFVEDSDNFFGSVIRWVKMADIEAPAYSSKSKKRDTWLTEFWPREPHLAGVLNSVVAIDKNRGWTLTGPDDQVDRFLPVFRNAEGGMGWRTYFSKGALSFYSTDLGFVTETARDGEYGPLAGIYNVDPTLCEMSGKVDYPLKYKPFNGKVQSWEAQDYFRVMSMPSMREEFNNLGYCAVSRALELAKIMVAVYEHDQEKLGARAPKGLLLLHNVTEGQWEEAMAKREADMTSRERRWYGSVAVLASGGIEQIDAKLVALSQLPEGFDLETFTHLLMYGYALCFGYDPAEFWPVKFGGMSRATESQIQHVKATGKGGLDAALAYQDRIQQELPETIEFLFEQRDVEGQMSDAALQKAKIDAVKSAYSTQGALMEPLISREEGRSMLAEMGVIPSEWTELEEDVQATDKEEPDDAGSPESPESPESKELMRNPIIQRAAMRFPDKPIVRYSWPDNRREVLFSRGSDALGPRIFRAAKLKRRQDEGEVLFEDDDVKITELDVARSVKEAGKRVDPEFAELLQAETMTDEEVEEWGEEAPETGE